ncbi:MAG: MarR family transcriptional regulator [Clostridia bacterium]|nr:MarR family transcriptional regulator [Deltaproteobacteria bacterium]
MANKAIIGTESYAQASVRALEIARRFDAGESVSQADFHLNFSGAAQLFAEMTPARLALLEALKQSGPLSIYALAKQVGRNYSNVHRDIKKLLELGLVEKDDAKRVLVPWDEIIIHAEIRHVA